MLCESYQRELKDALAHRGALPLALGEHIERCEGCREALAAERQLFEAMDAALQNAVNAEVPASLVPQVRAQAVLQPVKLNWRWSLAALATAGIAVAVVGWSGWRPPSEKQVVLERPAEAGKQAGEAAQRESTAQAKNLPINLLPKPRAMLFAARGAPESLPEVIIAPDERAGLQKYEKVLRLRLPEKQFVADDKAQEALEIKPLEIAEMDLKQVAIQPLVATDAN